MGSVTWSYNYMNWLFICFLKRNKVFWKFTLTGTMQHRGILIKLLFIIGWIFICTFSNNPSPVQDTTTLYGGNYGICKYYRFLYSFGSWFACRIVWAYTIRTSFLINLWHFYARGELYGIKWNGFMYNILEKNLYHPYLLIFCHSTIIITIVTITTTAITLPPSSDNTIVITIITLNYHYNQWLLTCSHHQHFIYCCHCCHFYHYHHYLHHHNYHVFTAAVLYQQLYLYAPTVLTPLLPPSLSLLPCYNMRVTLLTFIHFFILWSKTCPNIVFDVINLCLY